MSLPCATSAAPPRRPLTLLLAWLITLALPVFSAEPVALSGHAMGTTWSAKWLQPATPLDPDSVSQKISARLEALEHQFSTYRPDSVLSRFNASSSTDWTPVPPELAEVVIRSREISALTDGAFDITVHPLLILWGLGPQRGATPTPTSTDLARARARVDWRRLEARLSPPALRKTIPNLSADPSSLAKGFAVDALSHLLASLGATNHLVRIGGDLRASGPGPTGNGWPVGIERPDDNAPGLARIVVLRDRALSTSGNHRNFVAAGARRIGHIVDPRSGQPVSSPLASVSVVHADCATSSALATALFVLGSEAGTTFARRHALACLFLVRAEAVLTADPTPEFEKLPSLPLRPPSP